MEPEEQNGRGSVHGCRGIGSGGARVQSRGEIPRDFGTGKPGCLPSAKERKEDENEQRNQGYYETVRVLSHHAAAEKVYGNNKQDGAGCPKRIVTQETVAGITHPLEKDSAS